MKRFRAGTYSQLEDSPYTSELLAGIGMRDVYQRLREQVRKRLGM